MALTSDKLSLLARLDGHEVEIKSQEKSQTLRTAKWIVLTAGEFPTADDAQTFGERLRAIVGIAGICTRNGIDVGEDRPTGRVNESRAREIGLIAPEERLHPNVHGLIVYPDDGLSRFPLRTVTGIVTADPVSFVETMEELSRTALPALGAASAGVRILNLALKSSEPLTQAVLAISVIEALGQDQKWTENQKRILAKLADKVEKNVGVEEQEIADALRRSVHRIGLRQGVLRVLGRLGLDHLKKDWDSVYNTRSPVFHGTRQLTDPEMQKFAQSAITLCGQIVVALLRQGGVEIPLVATEHYPNALNT
jgi:hypothetical protein